MKLQPFLFLGLLAIALQPNERRAGSRAGLLRDFPTDPGLSSARPECRPWRSSG